MLAIGIVLTFRASNVLNFAHAAMGMYVAYAYFGLRNFDVASTQLGGDLVLPIIGLPSHVHVLDRPTVLTALLIAVGLGAVLGAIVYGLVFRPLRHAPPLARVIASLGVFLYLQSVMQLRTSVTGAGSASLQLGSLLPSEVVHVGGAVVPVASFVLVGLAIVTTVGLVALFRFTRFGLATRASAQNETGAVLSRLSPDRLGFINWMLATVLAGLAIILFAGISSHLDPTETSLLIVPALAAALLGRLDSFTVTTIAALAISMAQSALATFQIRAEWLPGWLPHNGFQEALPVILIIIAITLRGAHLPSREEMVVPRLPTSPEPRRPVVAAVLLGIPVLVALLTLDAQWRLAIVVSLIAAVVALSSVVLTGYVGQISLAQYAFAGLSAFVTAKLALAGLGFPWAALAGIALTTGVGILVGIPALRVRGMTLAVATLGVAVAIEALVFRSPSLNGITDVPHPRLLGLDLGFLASGADNFRVAFGVLSLVALAGAAVAVANLRRSPTGLRWLAVRSNERSAAASGVNVSSTKLSAFAISSALAGLGGALLAYELPALSPEEFLVVGALAVLALCYLGGIATISGALIAGALASGGILTLLQSGATGQTSSYQFAVSGIVLIVVVILYPDGLSVAARRGVGTAGRPAMMPSLEVEGLAVRFGGLLAVDDVSFSLPQGGLMGLIGPNGAGKTTTIDALCGFVPAARGTITLAGQRLDGSKPHARARAGLVRTFQTVELFDDLTLRENLLVAATRPRWLSPMLDAVAPRRGSRGVDDDVEAALDVVGLRDLAEVHPPRLSHGQQRLAGLARALATRPEVLLLDEPAAGLDPDETRALGELLRSLPGRGISVLLVEHDMTLVLDVCEELTVLDLGRVIASGPAEVVRNDPAVIDAYLGTIT